MKTIVIILLSSLLLMIGDKVHGQKKIKFYYYPAANVYYNTTTATYSFIENGNWVSASSLPATYTIKHTPRHIVYHTNAQVWNNNYTHRSNYAPEAKIIDAGYQETHPKQEKGSLLNRNLFKKKRNF